MKKYIYLFNILLMSVALGFSRLARMMTMTTDKGMQVQLGAKQSPSITSLAAKIKSRIFCRCCASTKAITPCSICRLQPIFRMWQA